MYVVHTSFQNKSTQFIQYKASAIFTNDILLSLAINAHVFMSVTVQSSSMLTSFSSASLLCLTIILSFALSVLR